MRWQPGYVYPPVFFPGHPPLDVANGIFFAAIALVVGILTFRRPALGVGALIVCSAFADARYIAGSTSITVPKAALVGFFVALLIGRPAVGVIRDRRALVIAAAFATVLGSIALSGISALYPDAVAREFAKWLEYATTFVAAAVAFAADPDDRPVWGALIGLAYLEAALSLGQLLFGAPAGVFVNGVPVPRVTGSLEGPNQFSGWLDMLVPVLLARLLTHRDRVLLGAVAVSILAQVATLSRAGIAAAIVAIAIVLLCAQLPLRVALRYGAASAAVLVVLVGAVGSFGLGHRFASTSDVEQRDGLGTRPILWSSAIQLWERSPIVGVGAGNFERELGTVGHPEIHTHANSAYLQALAETGVVGLAAVVALIGSALVVFGRSCSRRPLVVGVLAGNIALAFHQVFDDLWFFPKVGAFWALLLGIGLVEILSWRDDVEVIPENV